MFCFRVKIGQISSRRHQHEQICTLAISTLHEVDAGASVLLFCTVLVHVWSYVYVFNYLSFA